MGNSHEKAILLKARKDEILNDLKDTFLDFSKWESVILETNSFKELEDNHRKIILFGKRAFLLHMLDYINNISKQDRATISYLTKHEELDDFSKRFSVLFYKKNLIDLLIEHNLHKMIYETRISKSNSIEEINAKTKDLRKRLYSRQKKTDELKASLYGSEYISTRVSIRAILTGMIY